MILPHCILRCHPASAALSACSHLPHARCCYAASLAACCCPAADHQRTLPSARIRLLVASGFAAVTAIGQQPGSAGTAGDVQQLRTRRMAAACVQHGLAASLGVRWLVVVSDTDIQKHFPAHSMALSTPKAVCFIPRWSENSEIMFTRSLC